MSNNSQSQLGNPLLYSLPLGRVTLEPYWLVIIQLIVLQFLQRLWNRFNYSTWFLQVELVILFGGKYRSDKSDIEYPFQVDFFDTLQSLLIAGHFVWYSILQGSCMSAANATTWACFNIYGYALTNYVTPSAISLSTNLATKGARSFRILFGTSEYDGISKARVGLYCICCYLPMVAYVLVFIPYFNVNIFPMFLCYEWLVLIWLIGVSIASVLVGLLLTLCPINHKLLKVFETKSFMLAILASTQLTMLAYLFALLFNYSQYWYFGDTYIHAIASEYQSRDTNKYFQVWTNSTEQIAHTVLATF